MHDILQEALQNMSAKKAVQSSAVQSWFIDTVAYYHMLRTCIYSL